MKKLNITKEQFNKSRYFKNKYGTLEYVSESGKVFKTDKGKVLMFVKEHHDPEGFTKNPEIQKLSKKVLSKMRKMRKTLEEYGLKHYSEKYRLPDGKRLEIELKAGRDDSVYTIGGGTVLTLYVEGNLTGWGISIKADEQISFPYLFRGENKIIEVFNVFLKQFSKDFDHMIYDMDKDEFGYKTVRERTESTEKFGKKFNESSVRKCTNELLDYAEAYPNFWETIAKACLSYMSEDEVEDMARMNDLLPDDDEYTDY